MLFKQFVFVPQKSDSFEKDLFSEVSLEGDNTVLTLKNNVLVGYSDSFYNAMDDTQFFSEEFVLESITGIKMDNGLAIMNGKGINTSETFSNLLVEHFAYDMPDMNRVQIEIEGILKPPSRLKGVYRGLYVEEYCQEENIVTLYAPYKGGTPISRDLSRYTDNLMTEIKLSTKESQPYLEISYVGVKMDSGESYRSVIYSGPYSPSLAHTSMSVFLPFAEKGFQYYRKNNLV